MSKHYGTLLGIPVVVEGEKPSLTLDEPAYRALCNAMKWKGSAHHPGSISRGRFLEEMDKFAAVLFETQGVEFMEYT